MKWFHLLTLLFAFFVIHGCGGGGDNSISQAATPSKGIFTDSPVAGVAYKTATLSGITDATGEFQYYPGETVTFSIGDVILGSATAGSKITPIDLGTSYSDTNPKTINIARFLQSLDSDGNHGNGIRITPEIRAEMAGKSIDFSKSVTDFDDADMQALFTSLNSKGVFTDGTQRCLASDLTAQYNLRHSLNPSVNPFDGMWKAEYRHPDSTDSSGLTISAGGRISIGGYSDVPQYEVKILQPITLDDKRATITISNSIVTFAPVPGYLVVGTITTSGIISFPDKNVTAFGSNLVLSYKFTLNSDGSINGEWTTRITCLDNGCHTDSFKAVFYPYKQFISPGSISLLQVEE